MSYSDLAYMPATEMARLIRRKELSPVDLVQAVLGRIDEVDPALNCFCFTFPEEALEKARAAEAAVMAGGDLDPLHGVPFAIKDVTPTRGKRTTMGSYVYENWVPDHDAVIVQRMDAAGGIMVGKTTTPEFAHSNFCHSPLWGVTRNPWNLARTPGGSSGGARRPRWRLAACRSPRARTWAARSAFRRPIAASSATSRPSGASPWTCCPAPSTPSRTSGRWPTVDDAALMLGVTQGPHDCDIFSLTPALETPLALDGDLRGRRLAFSLDLGFFAIDDEVAANARAAAEALADAGAEIVEVGLEWTRETAEALWSMWDVFMAAYFGQHLEAWRDKMDPRVVEQIEAGRAASAVDYKRLEYVRTRVWRDLAGLFETHDALLCPTATTHAPAAEAVDSDFFFEDDQGRFHGLDATGVFNLVAPCPALSVPSGFTADGLPTSLQIVGRRHDDVGALNIGKALERQRPWSDRRPPL